MNHRTGRLTWRDFEPSESEPAPTFRADPIEHTSDFGVVDAGATFAQPAPRRMWQEEIDSPWLVRLYGYALLLTVALSCVFAWRSA